MDKLHLSPESFGFDIIYRNDLKRFLGVHSHDFHEMVYVFSGTGKHVTEQGTYDIGPGNLFVVPPGRSHGYEDRNQMVLVNIMFDLNRLPYPADLLKDDPHFQAFFSLGEKVTDDFRIRNKLELTGEDQEKMESVIHELLNEYNQEKKAKKVRLLSLLADLFVTVVRFCSVERYACSRDLIRLQYILKYISDNCSRQITVPELAKKFGLSQKNLERLFLQSVQMPPVSYLIDFRLKTAAEKIRNSELTISEAAFQCGFSDSNYFTKLFKRKYGISPRDYRRNKISCGD